MPLSYRDRVIADGASNYWRLDEKSGTVALDIIGGATGVISGGVTLNQPGALADGDKAMTFDGVPGAKIQTAATVTLPASSTVETWVKSRFPGDGTNGHLFNLRPEANLQIKVDSIAVGTISVWTGTFSAGARRVDDGGWHHVAVVFTGTQCLIYIDGTLDTTTANTHSLQTAPARLGYDAADNYSSFSSHDEVAIYPRALTAPEIAAHYQAATIPSLPDSSAIDNALIAKLASDATLLALCPNGVYYAEAKEGLTRFVIVQVQAATDIGQFGGTAYEDVLFQVEARMLSTAGGDIQAAAARIHDLLHDQPLTVAGFSYMTVHREERIRMTERNDTDPSLRWFRRGGLYRVQMSYP